MGELFGNDSRQTFSPMGTHVSNPCWNSPLVKSSDSLKASNEPPIEAVESGLSLSLYVTIRSTCNFNLGEWS